MVVFSSIKLSLSHPLEEIFEIKFRRFHIDELHVVSLRSEHTRKQVSVTGLCNKPLGVSASKISHCDIMQGQVVATICSM